MPARKVPTYRCHKSTRPDGKIVRRAIVRLDKKVYYLGPYGSPESRAKYARLINEWQAGRLHDRQPNPTIINLVAAYLRHAKTHYVKDGEPTGELENLRQAVRPLLAAYGDMLVRDFGPLRLATVRDMMVAGYTDRRGKQARPLCRNSVNSRVSRIKRVFKWGASNELVPADVYLAVSTVPGLQRGRTPARESKPVTAAADCDVDAALAYMPDVVADMVRLQRITGARPGEIRILRPVDVDRSVTPWLYRPASHKTEHHGHERLIFLGPQAQAILRPYLLRDAEAFCFSPADSERKRQAAKREARKSKVQPSQLDRRKPAPKRSAGERYTKDAYARAIARACDLADEQAHEENPVIGAKERIVPRWTPNQLRHATATRIRKQYGLEAAQVILGHSRADVTQVYAERDKERAANIMKEIG